jgi:hypothetical protein
MDLQTKDSLSTEELKREIAKLDRVISQAFVEKGRLSGLLDGVERLHKDGILADDACAPALRQKIEEQDTIIEKISKQRQPVAGILESRTAAWWRKANFIVAVLGLFGFGFWLQRFLLAP